jgi:surfactin synthase thioesterase subunit
MSDAHIDEDWFTIARRKPDAQVRLFCLPHAGGGASAYVPWARALQWLSIEVCGVQLAGREQRIRETPATTLSSMADAITAIVQPRLDRPYALFGHSMGAILAFEVTRRLRDAGAPLPAHLFVSGAPAPMRLRAGEESLAAIGDDDRFLDGVDARYGRIPPTVRRHAELRQLTARVLRADIAAVESYVYAAGAPVPVDLSAYGGAADRLVAEPDLIAWGELTAGRFSHRLFDGDHFYLADAREALLSAMLGRLGPWLWPPGSPASSRSMRDDGACP